MLERAIQKMTAGISVVTAFDQRNFTFTTTTALHGKVINTTTLDVDPMYSAFRDRMMKEFNL